MSHRTTVGLVLATLIASAAGCGGDGPGVQAAGLEAARATSPGVAALGQVAAVGALAQREGALTAVNSGQSRDWRAPYTPRGDVQFIDYFAPRHAAAIAMVEHVVARGLREDVRELAEQLRATHAHQLEVLRAARQTITGSAESPPIDDPYAAAAMAHLEAVSGEALDRAFLEHMIPHHGAGLAPAERALASLQVGHFRELVRSMVHTQAHEIGEMSKLLASLRREDTESADSLEVAHLASAPKRDRRAPASPADDLAFVDFFIPHHAMAVEMAEHVLAHGARDDVRALAQRVRDDQARELDALRASRRALAGEGDAPGVEDPHGAAEMARFRALSGEALDRAFLEHMIPHHGAALPAAARSLHLLQRDELRQLAVQVFDAQAREIGEMRDLLDVMDVHGLGAHAR